MDESTTVRPDAGRRGLGRGMTVFLVVDVLLVLAVAVALAAFLSGGERPGDDAGGAPSTGSSASATPDGEPTDATDGPATFALPSGNIACDITDDAATCTIAESDAEPATEEGCAGVVGPIVTVTAEGASTPCVQGALPGPAAPGTPLLEYGESTTVGDFTCTSSTSGVTCRHDPSEAGFTLARAGHEIL
jgi:hypothetical protein